MPFIDVFLAELSLSAYIVHYHMIAMTHNTQAMQFCFHNYASSFF